MSVIPIIYGVIFSEFGMTFSAKKNSFKKFLGCLPINSLRAPTIRVPLKNRSIENEYNLLSPDDFN
ncbi:MAG: hypothetical protein ACTSRI_10990 [Promethearchaeota archaeon]